MTKAEYWDHVLDVLCTDGELHEFSTERVVAKETHGTGCPFSAALAAILAHGSPLPEAVGRAQRFVASALTNAQAAGKHYPLAV